MNNTFIASLFIILLLLIGTFYLYNCNKINNKNQIVAINKSKESFTSYEDNYQITFPVSGFYNDYNYTQNQSTNFTGTFNKDSFDDNQQKIIATFLGLIKAFDTVIKDPEYNYMVQHTYTVKITSSPTSINAPFKIYYETFAKTSNRTDTNQSINGDLFSIEITSPTTTYLLIKIIENINGIPYLYYRWVQKTNNFVCKITTTFIRKFGGYYSKIKLEILNNTSVLTTLNLSIDPSVEKHFFINLRNIGIIAGPNVSGQITSNVSGNILPSLLPGTNTRRTGVQQNVILSQLTTFINDFQTVYSNKLEIPNNIVDPEDNIPANVSMPSVSTIGLSINNDKNKSFFFNGEINGANVFKSIPLPQNDLSPIQDYTYSKGYLIILNIDNRIYYCKNCKIHTGEVAWTRLIISNTYGLMTQISYDGTNNILFLRNRDKRIAYCSGIGTTRVTINFLNPPTNEYLFDDMDVTTGKIAVIGGYTKFLYLGEYSNSANVRTPTWSVIDKSKTITSVRVGLKGLLGQDSNQTAYFCQFPCSLKGNNKWVQISDDVVSSISANANLLSIVKNNSIYACKDSCTKDNFAKSNQIGVYTAKAIDYLYPTIEIQESPFNNLPQIKLNSRSTKIDSYSTSINNLLVNIQNNITTFKTRQEQFQVFLLRQINQRDKYVNHINRGYDCLDRLIKTTGKAKNEAVCVDYRRGEAAYKASLLTDTINEKTALAAEIAANTPAPTAGPTPTVDPTSEFFSNNYYKWTEYFTNYSAETAQNMLDKLGNVKINQEDLLTEGEDIIAVIE